MQNLLPLILIGFFIYRIFFAELKISFIFALRNERPVRLARSGRQVFILVTGVRIPYGLHQNPAAHSVAGFFHLVTLPQACLWVKGAK